MANSTVTFELNYSFVFDFERNCDAVWKQEWMAQNWYLSIYISIVYLLIIHMGEKFMRSRPAYQLETPLFVWNLSNFIFTVFGTCRLIPEMYFVLTNFGFKESICNDSFFVNDVISCWYWFMVASKVTDLGDTVFIILKKKPLLALHWVHHSSALVLTWSGYGYRCSSGRWGATINFPIHSILYFYFTLKALKISLPRLFVWLILYLEILQLITLFTVGLRSIMIWILDEKCHNSLPVVLECIGIVTINFIVLMKYLFSTAKGKTEKRKTL